MDNSIALLAGSTISLLFSFLPGLKNWYNKFEPKRKQLIMIGVLALTALIVGALNCADVIISGVPVFSCDASGIGDLVEVFVLAVVANVGTHQSTNYLK